MRRRIWSVACLGAGLGLSVVGIGCGGSGPMQGTKLVATASGDSPPLAAENVGTAPSEEECLEFASDLEWTVYLGDMDHLISLIDWDAILQTAMADINAPQDVQRDFVRGFKESLGKPGNLETVLVQNRQEGGYYDLLRVRNRKPQRTILMRLLGPTGGLNYHEWILARRPDGSIKAVDLYVFATAEPITESIRRLYLPLAVHESRSALGRLLGKEQAFITHLDKFQRMTEAHRTQQHRVVLSTYQELPDELKREKSFLNLRLQAALALDDMPEYSDTIDTFEAQFPGDPCLDMLLIDNYALRNQYNEALACVERLERAVGGDPYLHVIRGDHWLESGDPNAARLEFDKAIAEDPDLELAYWSLVGLALSQKDFDETARYLDLIEDRFALEIGGLEELPEYEEFVRSTQYQEWLARRVEP